MQSTSTNKNQSSAVEACVGPNPPVQEILKNCMSGREYLKVKATSPQVNFVETSTQESCEQLMNQSQFLASLFLNLEGEIPVKGVRYVTP
jgi:hypothetical protein